jgi:hypothetical protein
MPAVRPRFHLAPCSKFRGHLSSTWKEFFLATSDGLLAETQESKIINVAVAKLTNAAVAKVNDDDRKTLRYRISLGQSRTKAGDT